MPPYDMPSYVCARDLPGHEDSVNAVAFSPDGRYLASGGDDCLLFIFEPRTGQAIHKVRCGSPVTALHWDSYTKRRLYVGLGDGRLMMSEVSMTSIEGDYLLRDRIGPVEALTNHVHGDSERLVICAGTTVEVWHKIQRESHAVWKQDRLRVPSNVRLGLAKEADVAPRSAHILHDGREVVVSYLDHGIICWNLTSCAFRWHLKPRTSRIGRTAVSGSGLLAASNLYDGFDIYDVAERVHLRTFPAPLTVNVPLPVLLTSDATELLTGSSSGQVCVFDPVGGGARQTLDHTGNIIQALAYCDIQGSVRLIATGSSETGRDTLVKVWQRNLDPAVDGAAFMKETTVHGGVRESTLPLAPRASSTSPIGPLDIVPGLTAVQSSDPGPQPKSPATGFITFPTILPVAVSLAACALAAFAWYMLADVEIGNTITACRLVEAWFTAAYGVCVALFRAFAQFVVHYLQEAAISVRQGCYAVVRVIVGVTVFLATFAINLLSSYVACVQGVNDNMWSRDAEAGR